jgi:hypothetical protein
MVGRRGRQRQQRRTLGEANLKPPPPCVQSETRIGKGKFERLITRMFPFYAYMARLSKHIMSVHRLRQAETLCLRFVHEDARQLTQEKCDSTMGHVINSTHKRKQCLGGYQYHPTGTKYSAPRRSPSRHRQSGNRP